MAPAAVKAVEPTKQATNISPRVFGYILIFIIIFCAVSLIFCYLDQINAWFDAHFEAPDAVVPVVPPAQNLSRVENVMAWVRHILRNTPMQAALPNPPPAPPSPTPAPASPLPSASASESPLPAASASASEVTLAPLPATYPPR